MTAPVPIGSADAARAKARTWIKISFVVVTIGALALTAAIVGLVVYVGDDTAPVRKAAHAFAAKLRKGDYAGAWESTSDHFKQTTPKATFKPFMTAKFPRARESTDATFIRISGISSRERCVWGTLDDAHGTTPMALRFVDERGAWRIDAIDVEQVDKCDPNGD